jgi:hypothetical protein
VTTGGDAGARALRDDPVRTIGGWIRGHQYPTWEAVETLAKQVEGMVAAALQSPCERPHYTPPVNWAKCRGCGRDTYPVEWGCIECGPEP